MTSIFILFCQFFETFLTSYVENSQNLGLKAIRFEYWLGIGKYTNHELVNYKDNRKIVIVVVCLITTFLGWKYY
jgi:hypothetical protein